MCKRASLLKAICRFLCYTRHRDVSATHLLNSSRRRDEAHQPRCQDCQVPSYPRQLWLGSYANGTVVFAAYEAVAVLGWCNTMYSVSFVVTIVSPCPGMILRRSILRTVRSACFRLSVRYKTTGSELLVLTECDSNGAESRIDRQKCKMPVEIQHSWRKRMEASQQMESQRGWFQPDLQRLNDTLCPV